MDSVKAKVAINGFGRIGRNAFKIAFERSDLEIVAINDLADTKTLAHLLKHDSNYGLYQHEVSYDDQNIIVNGKKVKVLSEKDPLMLPWKDMAVDVVIESTGLFVEPVKAHTHIDAGAKKVIISAPAKGDGADTIVLGVNEDKLTSAGPIISNASCTTNCIAPVMAIINDHIGIEKAMMSTVHSYTASQRLQDAPAKDLREARNAATNIVPTTTGASIAATQAIPELKGLFGGMSIRVPTPVVSISDFTIVTKRPVTVDEVNDIFKKAAADPYFQGIVTVSEEELVSSDYIGNSHSAIVDLKLTSVVGGNLLKVMAWYDNEWGYSNRLVEITGDVARLLSGQSSSGSPALEPKPAEASHDSAAVKTPEPFSPPSSAQAQSEFKPPEPMLEAPESAKEELLPAPKADVEHRPAEILSYVPDNNLPETAADQSPQPQPAPPAVNSQPTAPPTENNQPNTPASNSPPTPSIDGFHHF